MTLNAEGYTLIDLPPADEELLATFDELALDPYCGGYHRYRRFDQYRIRFEDGRWKLTLLPHRAFIQSRRYNTYAGGLLRDFEPLRVDPSVYVDVCAKSIPLPADTDWQINVHQCRVIARPDIPGISVPEGPHRDGHEYTAILVSRRHLIDGARTSLSPVGEGEPFFTTTLENNQALVFSDERMFHFTSNLEPFDGAGHRDLWMIVFDKWADASRNENMRYGTEYEKEAMLEE
jgi:hypothetical protein